MKKTVACPCTRDVAQTVARALRAYAVTAYPPGGSECAQVAREALFDTAAHCDAHTGGELTLRKRQLPQVRAALRWYFNESDSPDIEWPRDLPTILSGDQQA